MLEKRQISLGTHSTKEDLLLNNFFQAWSRDDTRKITSAIYQGHVTGSALAAQLRWTWDKVSRRTDELRSGGIVAKRRDNGWIRTTLTTVGVHAAQRLAARLQEPETATSAPAWTNGAWAAAAGALAHAGHRRLLLAIQAMPGATQAKLARFCGLSQPTASRWLRHLKAVGLVDVQQTGSRVRFHVRSATVRRLCAWLDDYAVRLAKGAQLSEAVVLHRTGAQTGRHPPRRLTPQRLPSRLPEQNGRQA